MKTAFINVFIDPQSGFLDLSLNDGLGGVLYVPQGEQVAPVMASMIAGSRDTTFILGQDYHPDNHISFMVNHPGVMEYRMKEFDVFLYTRGQPSPASKKDMYLDAQQPVHFFNGPDKPPASFPFPNLVLDENRNIVGLLEKDDLIRKVEVMTESGKAPGPLDRGRVTKVTGEYFDKTIDAYPGFSLQTLWLKHCVQGTESSLYPKQLGLPKGLEHKLRGNLKSDFVSYHDAATGNNFYVIRKGANPEMDSYGLGLENDRQTKTCAPYVFDLIAQDLWHKGYQHVEFRTGGLASNICSEVSNDNMADFLMEPFKDRGLTTRITYLPEISRGIPIPGGAETPFSLAGVEERLKTKHGIGTMTVQEAMAAQQQPASTLKHAFPGA